MKRQKRVAQALQGHRPFRGSIRTAQRNRWRGMEFRGTRYAAMIDGPTPVQKSIRSAGFLAAALALIGASRKFSPRKV